MLTFLVPPSALVRASFFCVRFGRCGSGYAFRACAYHVRAHHACHAYADYRFCRESRPRPCEDTTRCSLLCSFNWVPESGLQFYSH